MRSIVFAGIALLALSTTSAFAGEGNGDPFPGPDAAVKSTTNSKRIASGNDDPFHYYGVGQPSPTSGFTFNANNPDNPFPYSAPGMVVAQPAPTVGPGSPAPTVTAGHTTPNPQIHS